MLQLRRERLNSSGHFILAHLDEAAFKLSAIQLLDRTLSIVLVHIAHSPKPSRAAFCVSWDVDELNLSNLQKSFPQLANSAKDSDAQCYATPYASHTVLK